MTELMNVLKIVHINRPKMPWSNNHENGKRELKERLFEEVSAGSVVAVSGGEINMGLLVGVVGLVFAML